MTFRLLLRRPVPPLQIVFSILLAVFLSGGSAFARNADDIVKVLAIGNSFSEDAIENSLFDLAREKGIKMVVGNLYIGGAPLTLHVKNTRENNSVYAYRKTSVDGTRSATPRVSIERALADEDWDYISFQQASPLSGQLTTVTESLPELLDYVKARSRNPDVKFVYHQTWAYSAHSPHAGFANYEKSQEKMYQAIVNVSKEVVKMDGIDRVIPAGTAIQNARTSFIGDNFDRDGYHLRMPLGRYVAACTWFEKLFGIPVTGMKYKPGGVSEKEKSVAQSAAHFAVENPYTVTGLTRFQKAPKGVRHPEAILVDFGGTLHAGPWNPVTSPLEGKTYVLNDSLGRTTRVHLEMTARFNGKTGGGTAASQTPYALPGNVTASAYYGNAKKAVGGATITESGFRLTGLRRKGQYDIVLFASKMGDTLGVQDTRVVCRGKNEQQGSLNATDNISGLIVFSGAQPAADGTLTFTVTAGPANTNPDGFYYLSALRLKTKK